MAGPWTIEDHAQMRRDIERIDVTFDFYIDEMRTKKAKLLRTKHKMNSARDERFYKTFLFHNTRRRTRPALDFKCVMDSIVFNEHPNDASMDIYFGQRPWPKVQNLPPLDSHPVLTEGDREIIMALNHEHIALMRRCVAKARVTGHHVAIQRWLTKMEAICGVAH